VEIKIMTGLATQRSTIFEMMARLGIAPDAGVLPQFSLQYATMVQHCESCRFKKACRQWLDRSPAAANSAPWFCLNAEILFELQCDQPGPRRPNR